MEKASKFILWFEEIGLEDTHLVGGKNSSLGELIRELGNAGVRVPGGFAITAQAYQYLLEAAGIEEEMRTILADLDTSDMKNLQERGRKVRDLVRLSLIHI